MILGLLCQAPVFAESSSQYVYCMTEGKKALEAHNDSEAVRYFRLAHRLDPLADEPYQYLQQISQRGLSSSSEDSPDTKDLIYQNLMKDAQEAFDQGDQSTALGFFYRAHLAKPEEEKPVEYINLIKRQREERVIPLERRKAVLSALDGFDQNTVSPAVPQEAPRSVKSAPVSAPARPSKEAGHPPATPSAAVPVPSGESQATPPQPVKETQILESIYLPDLLKTGTKPTLRLEIGTTVKVQGKNIQRFMVVDEGFLEISADGRDHLRIKALKRGGTFVHIWDDAGRSTIYVETIFPVQEADRSQKDQSVEHARPFRFSYSNDWSAYYQGESVTTMERSTHPTFQQTFAMDGDTPYGVWDASQTRSGYNDTDRAITYTTGLTGIPVPGTRELNLRLFDASRSLSPLTFPGTRLRGVFADVNLFENALGLSFSHGKQQSTFAYLVPGFSSSRKVYVDAVRMTLFPKDRDNQVSLNYAKGYGPDHEDYLTDQAYSIEARKKLDRLALNAELARDDQQTASLAGARWEDGALRSTLNVRDINRDFTTVLSAPSNQGEVGATWSADVNGDRTNVGSVVDVYRNRLYFNTLDREAFNYDTEVHANATLDEDRATSLDTTARYVHTPGDASPRRFVSSSSRLSQSLNLWSDRTGTIFAGGGYQRSRYAYADASEYDRYSAICGVQVPLMTGTSCFANYEYSWLHEPASGLDSNPSVFNTGINYSKDLTKKLTGTCSLTYRNEQDVRGTNSFLAGEDSVSASSGLSYSPKDDVNLFVDSRLRSVWAQIPDNPSYNDLDLRFGMRMSWGSPFSWDPAGGVTGFVFKDKNGDGKFAIGEDEGIAGVKVKVGDQEAMTDARGWYRISVHAKRVVVMPVLETIPSGFVFSTAPFFKIEILQGMNRRVDFGMTTQSGIYGIVYMDKNNNGTPDRDDQFISRVQVILDGKTRQVSDARGAYFFKNVAPGKHTISIDMKFVPMDMIPGVKIKNEVDVTEGTTYVLHIPMKPNPSGDSSQ